MSKPIVEEIESREAAQGERMIEVKLRFWTNDLAARGNVIPKHAWTRGWFGWNATKRTA
jgi:hypothetical protein